MNLTLDCEFNGFGGELISMSLFAGDGRAFYAILSTDHMVLDPWVKENVIPILDVHPAPIQPDSLYKIKCSAADLPHEIFKFLSAGNYDYINIISDWPDDIKYFCESIITGPGTMIGINDLSFEVLRVDSWKNIKFDDPNMVRHNALCDAIALWIHAYE